MQRRKHWLLSSWPVGIDIIGAGVWRRETKPSDPDGAEMRIGSVDRDKEASVFSAISFASSEPFSVMKERDGASLDGG